MQEMETRYTVIKKMNGSFIDYVRIGLIPIHLTMWVIVFEAYKKHLETVKKSQAVEFVAMEYDLQRRQVYNIVSYMSATV